MRRAVPLAGLAALALGAGIAARQRDAGWPAGRPRAVLFDQIAADDPRSEFRDGLAATLGSAGYALTVVPPEEATVRRFQQLPRDRARLVIVRSHAALVAEDGRWMDDVALFTTEAVDLAHFDVSGMGVGAAESAAVPATAPPGGAPSGPIQLAGDELAALVPVRRTVGADRRPILGIGSRFVRDHLRGRFRDDAIVVLMGCDSLRGRALSEAFLARGAGAVVGWSDRVSAGHTDRATSALVARLAAGEPIADALRGASAEVGPDPETGALLVAAVR